MFVSLSGETGSKIRVHLRGPLGGTLSSVPNEKKGASINVEGARAIFTRLFDFHTLRFKVLQFSLCEELYNTLNGHLLFPRKFYAVLMWINMYGI